MIKHLRDQIVKLLKGKSSEQEAKAFIEIAPEVWDAYFDEQEWEGFQPGFLPNEWSDQWYGNIQKEKIPHLKRVNWMRWVSVAAACIVVVGITFCFLMKPHLQDVATIQVQPQNTITGPAKMEIVNNGQHLKVFMLPDGTKVELSGASKISYTEPAERDKRSLWLQGEAVFHVKKDSSRPFTVYTDNFTTTALGTVFRVSSFKGHRMSSVQLISGKVKVVSQSDLHQLFYLMPGEQCVFNAKEEALKKSTFGHDHQIIFKYLRVEGNSLNFINTPLPDVIRQLEVTYNVHILTDLPSSSSMKFTGNFRKTDPLDEILETLALLNNLQMKKAADTIYLTR